MSPRLHTGQDSRALRPTFSPGIRPGSPPCGSPRGATGRDGRRNRRPGEVAEQGLRFGLLDVTVHGRSGISRPGLARWRMRLATIGWTAVHGSRLCTEASARESPRCLRGGFVISYCESGLARFSQSSDPGFQTATCPPRTPARRAAPHGSGGGSETVLRKGGPNPVIARCLQPRPLLVFWPIAPAQTDDLETREIPSFRSSRAEQMRGRWDGRRSRGPQTLIAGGDATPARSSRPRITEPQPTDLCPTHQRGACWQRTLRPTANVGAIPLRPVAREFSPDPRP